METAFIVRKIKCKTIFILGKRIPIINNVLVFMFNEKGILK